MFTGFLKLTKIWRKKHNFSKSNNGYFLNSKMISVKKTLNDFSLGTQKILHRCTGYHICYEKLKCYKVQYLKKS